MNTEKAAVTVRIGKGEYNFFANGEVTGSADCDEPVVLINRIPQMLRQQENLSTALEAETQEIQDAVKAVGSGGPVPLSQRIYNLVRLMIDDRKRRSNEELADLHASYKQAMTRVKWEGSW